MMDTNGAHQRRLTYSAGYDGGAVFSPDGQHIIWKAWHATSNRRWTCVEDFNSQDKMSLSPCGFDIYVMRADGSEQRKIDTINSGPFSLVSMRASDPQDIAFFIATSPAIIEAVEEERVIRSQETDALAFNRHLESVQREGACGWQPNQAETSTLDVNVELYYVNSRLNLPVRVTYSPSFDGLASFSDDGTQIVWSSGRHASSPRSINLFVADWTYDDL